MGTIKKMMISFTAGAILGILYAPAKGSETREKLADVGDNIKDGWNNITDSIADRIDSIRDGVDSFADRSIERVGNTQFDTSDRAGYL